MERDNLYFLKISGTVSTGKQREFQQTIQFVFNHISSDCVGHNLTRDVDTQELYHLYSLWNSEVALYAFRRSHEYGLIKGAFQTLGTYYDTMSGRRADIQVFELDHLDN
jgi:heme-degrading monooxygenase HmoA